jgi:hypothetical protein
MKFLKAFVASFGLSIFELINLEDLFYFTREKISDYYFVNLHDI